MAGKPPIKLKSMLQAPQHSQRDKQVKWPAADMPYEHLAKDPPKLPQKEAKIHPMSFEFVKRHLQERKVMSPSTIGIASSELSEVHTDNISAV